MKRLIATGLALSLLGSSAAMAHDYGRSYSYNHNYGHSTPYRGGYGGYNRDYRYRDNGNTAAAIGVGILALGLFSALAANNNRYDYNDSYAPSYRYGYGPSYGGSYGYRR
jgi:hypothetical protein